MNKLYEFLYSAIRAHMEDEENKGCTEEEAFEAVIDWVANELKNMWLEELKEIEWNRLENIKDAAKDAQNDLKN